MKVIALDAGLAHLGVAIMEDQPAMTSQPWKVVGLSLITTEPDPRKKRVRQADDDARRVMQAHHELCRLIEYHSIKRLVVELPVAGAKSAPALKCLAYASALIACVVDRYGLFAEFYSAGEVRQCLLGRWTSSKEAAQDYVDKKYPQVRAMFPRKDDRGHVLDALAVFETALQLGNACRP